MNFQSHFPMNCRHSLALALTALLCLWQLHPPSSIADNDALVIPESVRESSFDKNTRTASFTWEGVSSFELMASISQVAHAFHPDSTLVIETVSVSAHISPSLVHNIDLPKYSLNMENATWNEFLEKIGDVLTNFRVDWREDERVLLLLEHELEQDPAWILNKPTTARVNPVAAVSLANPHPDSPKDMEIVVECVERRSLMLRYLRAERQRLIDGDHIAATKGMTWFYVYPDYSNTDHWSGCQIRRFFSRPLENGES